MVFLCSVSLVNSQWHRPISVRLWNALKMKMKAIKVANNSSVNLKSKFYQASEQSRFYLHTMQLLLTAGNYPPAAGNYPLAAGDYPLATGNYPPTTGNYSLAAGDYPPAAGNYPQAAGNYAPDASNYPPAASKAAVGLPCDVAHIGTGIYGNK